jgi:hypothetical protein
MEKKLKADGKEVPRWVTEGQIPLSQIFPDSCGNKRC